MADDAERGEVVSTPFGPGGRPFGGYRRVIAIVSVLIGLVILPIMLAEGAPDLARALGRWVETSDSALARLADSIRLPRSAFEIHLVAWWVVGVLAGLLAWSWRSFAGLGLLALASSLMLELAQEQVTQTRSTTVSDAIGNSIGIALGLAAAAVLTVAWRTIAARLPDRHDQGGDLG